MPNKTTARNIIDSLGSGAIEDRVGVSEFAVRHARTKDKFPASWYGEISAMCLEEGMSCPQSAFNFKSSDTKSPFVASKPKSGHDPLTVQGVGAK